MMVATMSASDPVLSAPTPGDSASVAVIGAGPAGLFAALRLAEAGCRVRVFDRMAAPARKFLMAGASGLNLTNAEPLDRFLDRYGPARAVLEPALRAFPPDALRRWAEALGQPCFTGSSGRVFPEAMKASPLLRAWLRRLTALGVRFSPRHDWLGWAGDALRFATPEGEVTCRPDATLLALGGASWPRLGSDGRWARVFSPGDLAGFRPSNCGFLPDWSEAEILRREGDILKTVTLRFDDATAQGDLTFTRHGVEGAPLYALSPRIRDAIARDGAAVLRLDLRPGLDEATITARLGRVRPRESLANRLRKGAALTPPARAVLLAGVAPDEPLDVADPSALARRIKSTALRLVAPEPLDRAISTAGGLRFDALDEDFMLRDRPGVFAAGEMLDWEAPTGGYLLQACFSTGHAAAAAISAWLGRAS